MRRARIDLLALILVPALAATVLADTKVGKGGADVPVGAGTKNFEVEVENDIGICQDITVTVYRDDNGWVPDITGVDTEGTGSPAKFDDNNDGKADAGENNKTDDDGSTDSSARVFANSGKHLKFKIKVTLDANTAAGTKLKIRLSTVDAGGQHWDLCRMNAVEGPQPLGANVPVGTHHADYGLVNGASVPLFMATLRSPQGHPFQSVQASLSNGLHIPVIPIDIELVQLNLVACGGLLPFETLTIHAAFFTGMPNDLQSVTLNAQLPFCPGSADTYGQGCVGAGDNVPTLDLLGCPNDGNAVQLRVANAMGGSSALVLLGLGQGVLPLPHGCSLQIAPLLATSFMLPLAPGGPGEGHVEVNTMIPFGTPPGVVTMQAVIFPDPDHSFAVTNAVRIQLP